MQFGKSLCVCAFTLKRTRAAARGGEMQEDGRLFAVQPNWEKIMGVWPCGCLIERNREEEKLRWTAGKK